MSNGVFNEGGYLGTRIHSTKVCVSSWKVSIGSRSRISTRHFAVIPIRRMPSTIVGLVTVFSGKNNFSKYWVADSDVVNSIDRFEALFWFRSCGDDCINCCAIEFLCEDGGVMLRMS